MYFPASEWVAAFLLTLAVEVPVAGWLLRRDEPDRVRLVLLVAFASLATHPIVWYVWTQVFLVGTPEYLVAAESWAVLVEAIFYWAAFRGTGALRAFLISLAANAASFLVGWAVTTVWPGVLG